MNQLKSAAFRALLQKIESRRDIPAKDESFRRVGVAIQEFAREHHLNWPPGGDGIILVAGTNGKGTICKTLEAMCEANGEHVGLFTSPHLISTTERIRTGGRDVSEDEFIKAFSIIEPIAERHGLSHFEILTLMMIEVFFAGRIRPRVKRAIVEVGVGGRWDPTRHLPHAVTVFAKLGLDHQNILGSTIEEIARHKFDAVDEGNLVVHAKLPEELWSVAKEYEKCGRWVEAPMIPFHVEKPAARWVLDLDTGPAPIRLLGTRAVENVSVALEVCRQLKIPILPGALERMTWPGRMEEVESRVYFSGDHNPQGVGSLEEILTHLEFRTLWLVVGIGKNKDAREIFEIFSSWPFADRIEYILTRTPFRGGEISEYGEVVNQAFAVCAEPLDALELAKNQASEDDLVLVTGSLYLIGYLKEKLQAQHQANLKPMTW